MFKTLNIIEIKGISILEQLRLEEALLRADTRSFCLINWASPEAIVMGISTRPQEVVDIEKAEQDRIPLIKRFSGGGTVYIDENTLFVTFIWQEELITTPLFPKEIMKLSEGIYAPVFRELPFSLRENDYVLGEKKIGGNAQYVQKKRFLHHTSFLWDFNSQKMNYLLQPKKQPKYRQNRPHHAFLTSLSPHFCSREFFINSLKKELATRFVLEELNYDEARRVLEKPHRKSTKVILF